MGWSLGHSQEKKCNSPDTSSVRNKMPGHPARQYELVCPSLPQRDTLLIECHVACFSLCDTPLHARATVTLPTRPVGR